MSSRLRSPQTTTSSSFFLKCFRTMDIGLFVASVATQIYLNSTATLAGTMGNSKSTDQKAVSLVEHAMNGELDKLLEAVGAANGDYREDIPRLLDQQDPGGNAAIHGAVFGGHMDVVKYLAEQGACLDLKNDLGCSPVWLAAGYDHGDVLEYLVQKLDNKTKSLLTTNKTGDTPLLAAASKGHKEICKQLLTLASDPEISSQLKTRTNNSQDSALGVAIGAGIGDDIFDQILDDSVIDLSNTKGLTPLLIACERDFVDMVEKLIAAGANVDITDSSSGDSILAVAAFCGSDAVVEWLIQHQPQLLNKPSDKSKCTPLWLATRAGHEECVKLLLKAGADKTIQNKDGLTPAEAAVKYKRENMTALLTAEDS